MNPRRLRSLATLTLVGCIVFAAMGCKPETNVSVTGASNQPAGIAVSGSGSVSVQPDVAVLNLGTMVTAPTVAAARERAATAMQAVQGAVRSKGVDEKDIRTVAFNINPQIRFTEARGQEVLGYQVTNIVSIKVRKLDTVSDVLDSAVAAGGDAVRVNGVSFSVDDPEVPLKDARTKALANAKAHAEVLAAAAGVKLGPARSITESGVPTPQPFDRQAVAPSSGAAPTPISPGQQELAVSVSVVYAIQ